MSYNIVLTTAEDVVSVVDAVVAKGSCAQKQYITEFTGIATEDQVDKALQMAIQLGLLKYSQVSGCYDVDSFLAVKLVSSATDDQKAVFMRLALEQYEPYKTFKQRYEFTKILDSACRQTKVLHSMSSNERDIKNTLISIATYAKALKSEGANLYSFSEEGNLASFIESSLEMSSVSDASLRSYWGEPLCAFVNNANVFQPLSQAFQKARANTIDARSVIVHSANAFESFLADYANHHNVSLAGKNGILQKKDALVAHLSKKHRGMIEYIGQVRNAADHGSDSDENGSTWTVSDETAAVFPTIVAIVIKGIYDRCFNHDIKV